MKGSIYPVTASTRPNVFGFYSIGDNGKFPMVIRFDDFDTSELGEKAKAFEGFHLQNLALLASTGETFSDIESFSDKIETKNQDYDMILNTVGVVSANYLYKYPQYALFISGATEARHRAFRIELGSNLAIMNQSGFNVMGYIDGNIEPFSGSIGYAFYLIRKI